MFSALQLRITFYKSVHSFVTLYVPIGGRVVAVVGEEVIVNLPEHMEGDSTIRGRHIVIGFPHHGIKIIQFYELVHQFVGQTVTLDKSFQFLQREIKDSIMMTQNSNSNFSSTPQKFVLFIPLNLIGHFQYTAIKLKLQDYSLLCLSTLLPQTWI